MSFTTCQDDLKISKRRLPPTSDVAHIKDFKDSLEVKQNENSCHSRKRSGLERGGHNATHNNEVIAKELDAKRK